MCIYALQIGLFVLCIIVNLVPRLLEWPSILFTNNTNNTIRTSKHSVKITQFTDLHLGESPILDNATFELMHHVMTEEQPDFVVFTGDQISGYAVLTPQMGWDLLKQALSIPATFNTPFATLYGNHDDELYKLDTLLWFYYTNFGIFAVAVILIIVFAYSGQYSIPVSCKANTCYKLRLCFTVILAGACTLLIITAPTHVPRSWLLNQEINHFPLLSYSHQGPLSVHGVSNYRLIFEGPEASMAMYFMDTGGGRVYQHVHPDQIQWLHEQGTSNASLAFMHIPPESYSGLYDSSICINNIAGQTPEQCSGSADLVDMLGRLGTLAVFVGHDHNNAWCCPYKTMQLCYGQHSGFGGYSMKPERGARIINVNMPSQSHISVDTWVHMHNQVPKLPGLLIIQ